MTLPNVHGNPRPSPIRWLTCLLVLLSALGVAPMVKPAFAAQPGRDAAPVEAPAASPLPSPPPDRLPNPLLALSRATRTSRRR
jgi:hypothetical protein